MRSRYPARTTSAIFHLRAPRVECTLQEKVIHTGMYSMISQKLSADGADSFAIRSHAPLLFALVLASGVACGMLVLRAVWGGGTGYSGLLWNLFLAWLPYGF